MVVVALVAILAALAMPSFNGAIANQRVKSAAQELQTLLQFARAEAVYKRTPVTVSLSTGQQWQAKDSTKVLREASVSDAVSITAASTNGVVFSVEGQAKPASGSAPYKVSISATGASRVQCLSVIGTGLVRLQNVAAGQSCP
ncbi:pilus assembly FimT family protein [Variovorax sp. DAIF25]|jgi:type IV fimbrial biogenesis protein FimT|uniref:GspH/FimT family pseudopilin n=1 Tax=Variovorax sp. DAIF25 TaxID=3080983 RepID=UPI003D6BB8E6